MIMVLLLLVMPAVNADVLVPGTKGVDYCFRISNMEDYPDYEFIIFGAPVTGVRRIVPGECVSFYKLSHLKLYALEKQEFERFSELISYKEHNESWRGHADYNYSIARQYFEQEHDGLYDSGLELSSYGAVAENDPLDSVEDILTIKSLAGNKFEIEKTEVVYTYTDGKTEVKPYINNVTPEPSGRFYLPFSWYLIFIPIAAAFIIFWILRKRKK